MIDQLSGNHEGHRPTTPNVLDLRQVMAERSAQAKTVHRQSRWARLKRPKILSEPIYNNRDWPWFRHEAIKFFTAAWLISLPLLGLFGFVHLTKAADQVQQRGIDGLAALQSGGSALTKFQIIEAQKYFNTSREIFDQAAQELQATIWQQGRVVKYIPIIGTKYQAAEQLIATGQHLATAGQALSRIIDPTTVSPSAITVQTDGIVRGSIGVLGPMLRQPQDFQQAITEISAALKLASHIDLNILPEQYRARAEELAIWQPVMANTGARLQDLSSLVSGLFAPSEPQEYLVLFQNNDELRATGGFIGTYLLVKFEQGTFKILDSPGNGPYALKEQIPNNIMPPQPILSLTDHWEFQDTNWFLDAPTSSQFVLDFYRQARGFKPAGVIYLTPNLIEEILGVTGPITFDQYGVVVTKDNFLRLTENQVEFNYDKATNKPKQFLIDFTPVLLSQMSRLSPNQAIQATTTALMRADQGDLIIYSDQAPIQQAIERLGWSGQILNPDHDYLAVVESNLGGMKTDRIIKTEYQATIEEIDQKLVHQVTITRQHQGQIGTPLTGYTNRSYIRLYVPINSELQSISGIVNPPTDLFYQPKKETVISPLLQQAEGQTFVDPITGNRISNESGKRVFGAWSFLPPGQSQTITFNYITSLPSNQSDWALTWQKQPGALPRSVSITFKTSENHHLNNPYPQPQANSNKSFSWQTDTAYNRTVGINW